MRYIQWFSLKNSFGDEEPYPTNEYYNDSYLDKSKEGRKIKLAIDAYNKGHEQGKFQRALSILNIYEKARKYDQVNKKKSFWEKLKDLFCHA